MAKICNPNFLHPSHGFILVARLLLPATLSGLVACGGGGGDSSRLDDINGGNTWVQGEFKAADNFDAECAVPRTGTDPSTGRPYPDKRGSTLDENNWLRSWTNDTYLWYSEVNDRNPALYADPLDYFDLLKTTASTPSGAPKDQYHFTYDTAEWNALSGSGVSAGYGVQWVLLSPIPPRDIRIAYTEPGTPATAEGINLARGARVIAVNQVDAINDNTSAGVDTLNNGLFPSSSGQMIELVVRDVGSDINRTVTLTSTSITSTPVQHVKTVATESGEVVGYMLFNDHIATSEQLLVDAIEQLAAAGATQLVLDLRYNGGGILNIASQLAYMIAGNTPTAGKAFYDLSFNDKHPTRDPVTGATLAPVPFYRFTSSGSSLPSLGLERVYILAGSNTCSASEAIINGLRGVDVGVILIGETTCGKPYGFYPTDNCGTTYFTVQFKGNNHKGFGEYSDGFVPATTGLSDTRIPGCAVADDYTHALGDPQEARFAAALTYMESGECPATGSVTGLQKPAFNAVKDGLIYKPEGLRSTIMSKPAGSGQ